MSLVTRGLGRLAGAIYRAIVSAGLVRHEETDPPDDLYAFIELVPNGTVGIEGILPGDAAMYLSTGDIQISVIK